MIELIVFLLLEEKVPRNEADEVEIKSHEYYVFYTSPVTS